MTVPSITDDLIAEIEEYTQMTQHERGKEQASIIFEDLRLLVTRLRDSELDAERYRHLLENAVSAHSGEKAPVLVCALDLPLISWREEVSRRIDTSITKERTE